MSSTPSATVTSIAATATPAAISANPCASLKPKSDSILDESASRAIPSVIPKERQDLLKWNGWGYKDSRFVIVGLPDNDSTDATAAAAATESSAAQPSHLTVAFTGDRYPIGNLSLPHFSDWAVRTLAIDLRHTNKPQPLPTTFPAPLPCAGFLDALAQLASSGGVGGGGGRITYTQDGVARLIRSHGQTLADIHALREGHARRLPDCVVWPTGHEAVRQVVRAAHEHNVAVIPFGGGTSVSGSITCPAHERRPICVLDTSQMNRMLWLDRGNMVACFEAGVFGQDLERELRRLGLTVGHEPDSYEFSTLGGWVATRASGMKKNVYGNIEDLVVRVRMVCASGEVLERHCGAPRVSCGPDWQQVILGSEGTLGVITEVVLKVRNVPAYKRYGSLVFPDFASGVQCLRRIAAQRLQPASIRLVDNEQFQFGQALKPPTGLWTRCADVLKRAYLTQWRGFEVERMCVATLVFEGEADEEQRREKRIVALAEQHGGISAGAENGERGYVLTFVIAYIRDMALEHFIVAESFETSVPWDRCEQLCRNTKQRVRSECNKMHIAHYLISCRVTQTYDAGAAVYFYFGFNYVGRSDPVEAYEHIENCARDEILAAGGSLSHHHGVGKLRSRWYPHAVGTVGVGLYRAAKRELDPKNIFAAGNLLPVEEAIEEAVALTAKL